MYPLLLVLGLTLAASQGTAPRPVAIELPSGVTLVVEENRSSPTVAIEIMVRAGSARETDETAGCAHLLEHLAFAGTPNHPGNEIDRKAEELGYRLQANTQVEVVRYYATCLRQDWKEVLGLFADAIVNLSPTQEAFRRHQRVVQQEIVSRRDNPIAFLIEYVRTLAYPNSGYGRTVTGTLEDVRRRTLQDVLRFHKRWYTTGNTVVAIVGDVSREEAEKQVELWFGGLARGQSEPYPGAAWSGPKVLDETGPYTKAAIAIAYPAIPASRIEDSAVLDTLVALLEERIATGALAEKALAFEVHYQTLSHPGMVVIALFCEEDRFKEVAAKLAEEVERVRRGDFTEGEFRAARNKVRSEEAYVTETNAGRAYALAYWLTVGGKDIAERYARALATVSHAEGKRIAAEVLDPAKEIRVQWHPPKRSSP